MDFAVWIMGGLIAVALFEVAQALRQIAGAIRETTRSRDDKP